MMPLTRLQSLFMTLALPSVIGMLSCFIFISERILMEFNVSIEQELQKLLPMPISAASNQELYYALLQFTKQKIEQRPQAVAKKKVYYISSEFLIGKMLSNNLINLGLYDEVRNLLSSNGKALSAIEEIEPEPSLGNGGLGRLAACFLDSIASLDLPGNGISLNYHYGLFKQKFDKN